MVSPHVSYADQAHYKALDSVHINNSKKIIKNDNLPEISAFINKTQTDFSVWSESIQACSVVSIISPRQSLSILSTIRLLL